MPKRNKPWIPGIVIHYQNLERCKEFLAAYRELQTTSHKLQAASDKPQASSNKRLDKSK